MTNKVKFFRTKRRLRQIDLARLAHVSVTTIWMIESGYDGRAGKELKRRICNALRCKYEEVFPKKPENLETVESRIL